MSTRQHEAIPRPFDSARGIYHTVNDGMSITQDIRRIYELEAMLSQAFGILLQIDSAIKALKPPSPKKKKMTRAECSAYFDRGCEQIRKDKRARLEKAR